MKTPNYFKIIETLCEGILSSICALILLPLLIGTYILFGVVSVIVNLLLRIKFGKRITRSNGPDLAYAKTTDISLPYINIIGSLKGQPIIEEILETFTKDVIEACHPNGERKYKKFTQTLTREFGYYVWKDVKHFDLKNHIKLVHAKDIFDKSEPKLQCPSSKENGVFTPILSDSNGNDETDSINEKFLQNLSWEDFVYHFMQKYGTLPMDEKAPQWEFIVMVKDESSFLVLFRLHHSITDGINLARFVTEAIWKTNVFLPFEVKKPGRMARSLLMLWSYFFLPLEIVKIIKSSLNQNPLHGPKLSGKKIFVVSKCYPLSLFRTMKRQAQTSINDILFSCLSKALALHYHRRSVNVEETGVLAPYPRQNLQKPLTLGNKFALSKFMLPTPMSLVGTRWLSNNVELTSSVEKPIFTDGGSALQRLYLVKSVLDEAKHNTSLLCLNSLGASLCYYLPACITEYILRTKGITLFLSNIPGPQKELKYWNGVQEDIIFWIPDRAPMGVGISFMTCNGRLRIGLIADKVLIQEKEEALKFLEDFERELFILQEQIKNIRRPITDIV